MKYIIYILSAALTALMLFSCGNKGGDYHTFDGFAQGSTYHFVVRTQDTVGLQRQIDSLIRAVDMSMSVYEENSLVNRLNRNETDLLDEHIIYCIEVSEKISRLTDGAFDITIKPVTEAWGFAGRNKTDDPNVDSLLQFVGFEKIRIEDGRLIKERPEVQIDLNTVAQGYTADRLGLLMESRGISDYLVEIGGEVFCRGRNPKGRDWVIGIDEPFEGNHISGGSIQVMLALSDQGLATSGNYRKYYTDAKGRKITHIVDARTGISNVSNLLSATVVAENATLADVYGTMFMIIGLEESIEFLASHPDIWGYLVYSGPTGGYEVYVSPQLEKRIVR